MSQRPASRFFAAFYRWNRYTQGHVYRPVVTAQQRRNFPHVQRPASARSFATTRASQQTEQPVGQPSSEEVQALSECSTHRKDEEGIRLPEELIRPGEEKVVLDGPATGESLDKQSLEDQFSGEAELQQEEIQTEELRKSVRHVMRNVPYPVVVVTAAHIDPDTKRPVPLGVAVSSFNTVTLNPPTISFNIKRPSQTLDAIKADNGRFRVHFLSSRHKSAVLADSFTQGNHSKAYTQRLELVNMGMNGPLPVSAKPAEILDSMVVAAMECRVVEELTVADHVIVAAQVSRIRARDISDAVLLYVQGQYVSSARTTLRHNMPASLAEFTKTSSEDPGNHPLWSVSLFPGPEDRASFKTNLLNFIKKNPKAMDLPLSQAPRYIFDALGIRDGALGVRMAHAISIAAQEKGREPKSPPHELGFPALREFYGRLTPTDVEAIIERAKQFVRNDPLFLSLDFETLFMFLGVSAQSNGLLASDIMNALRVDNLIAPFEPTRDDFSVAKGSMQGTLARLEQLEHRMLEYLKTLDDPNDIFEQYSQIATAIGVPTHGWPNFWFRQTWIYLHVRAFPDWWDNAPFDFRGHLTIQEARLAVARIIKYLDRPEPVYHQYLKLSWPMILRECKIHPLITGFDPIFFLGRLKAWFCHCTFAKYKNNLLNLLHGHFRHKVTVAELEERVDELVQNCVKRAVTLGQDELRTALGIRTESSIRLQKDIRASIPIRTHHLVQLLRHSMEKRYKKFSTEEREAVDQYLQQNQAPVTDHLIRFRSSENFAIRKYISRDLKQANATQDSADEIIDALDLTKIPPQFYSTSKNKPGIKGFTAYGFQGKK